VKSDKLFEKRLRRHAFLWVVTMAFIGGATPALSHHHVGPGSSRPGGAQSDDRIITPIPFGEMNGNIVYNASGVVPLADSRFLFCDNKCGDALFELDLTADGQMKGRLIRRPLRGLAGSAIKDLEAMTLAEENGRRFVFSASSLSVKAFGEGELQRVPSNGLLRVTINPDESLSAENMPDFRDWFIRRAPEIGASAKLTPDEGGLNVEGLAWDQSRHALLFGLRSPLSVDKPLVIPVRVKNLAGPWTTDNLEILPAIRLSLDAAEGAQGIRSIEYVASRHSFVIVVGKAISKSKAPFALYEWNGGPEGRTRRLDVAFAGKMKPEGVTSGTVAGRPVFLFMDDGGGYRVLWLDKTRL